MNDQRSLLDQLKSVLQDATKAGHYDAADWLQQQIAQMEARPFYGRVWDILVEHAGACTGPRERETFIHAFASPRTTEYRFQGLLGFGGKFRRNSGGVYVDCYPEDLNPTTQAILDKVNGLIAKIES